MNAYYTNQYISTTLASVGGIDDSATTGIILASVTNITTDKPGIACLSYTDPIDTSKAEWITYTSIDSGTKELQGVTRGQEGYAAKSHSNGVTVAFPLSKSHINNLNDALIIGGNETNLVTGVIDDDTMATASATKLATSKSTKAYVDNQDLLLTPLNGWIPVSETWTRTGNHTFTVAGDLTAKYRKGAKVRYKDGGAYEYGTVISSSYSSPNTTVTLATNTDYTMAATTITDTYISYIENPEGFPKTFSFTPTTTCAGTNPSYSSVIGKFAISGGIVNISVRFENASGGTAGAGADLLYIASFPCSILNSGVQGVGAFYEQDIAVIKTIFARYATATSCYMHDTSGNNVSGADQSSASRYLLMNITGHLA